MNCYIMRFWFEFSRYKQFSHTLFSASDTFKTLDWMCEIETTGIGRAFGAGDDILKDPGSLIVKGLKSMWRQAAPIVQTTLHVCKCSHQTVSSNDLITSVIVRTLSSNLGSYYLIGLSTV